MTDRFTPVSVFRGHLKALQVADAHAERHLDRWAVSFLFGIPAVTAGVVIWRDLDLGEPGFLLAAAALLTAGQLSMFAQLAGWRDRLSERADSREHIERGTRNNVDSAVAHVAMSIYLGVILSVVVVVTNGHVNDAGALVGIPAAAVAFLGAYLAVLLLLIVPMLYEAYCEVNKVAAEVSGIDHR